MLTPSTTTVDLNVGYPNIATVVHAVQGDNQSRILTANLYDGGIAWTPPTGAVGVIKFHTPLGTTGMYDTDEEGNTAVTWTGNVATLRIVQNALAVAGDVPMQLSFYDDQGAVITSFLWETLVQPSVLTDTQFMQTDYYNILSQQISAILTAIADIPEPATSAPLMDGTAAVGTQNTFARGDHRHPTDTSRAPTNHASTDTTYGAASTTNYGHVKLSNTTPSMDGTAAVGSSTDAARANHVHPSDTSRVPTTRKINNMDLTADRTLTAENISYDDGLSVHTSGSVGEELSELKGSLTSLTNAHQLTGLDEEHIIKYSDGRIQLKYFDGTAQYILTFNPVNKSITQVYSADGVNFTEQWTTKVTEPTATMASQSKYTFDVGGEMTIEKSGHVVQIVGGFLCVTPELSSPGQLIASGLPAPSATIFCTLDSRNEAETSARVVLDTSGNLYFRYGHANSEYDLCIVYIGQ